MYSAKRRFSAKLIEARRMACRYAPSLRPYAKQEQAEIHWGDETGIRNDSQYGRSYAPRGQTPVIWLSANRHR
jgi:hypothetical protein